MATTSRLPRNVTAGTPLRGRPKGAPVIDPSGIVPVKVSRPDQRPKPKLK